MIVDMCMCCNMTLAFASVLLSGVCNFFDCFCSPPFFEGGGGGGGSGMAKSNRLVDNTSMSSLLYFCNRGIREGRNS